MYNPKTPYHSFGNRLGVLRRAFASDSTPDKYLRNYYKNTPISDWEEIYQEDKKLIDFYYGDCRINGGDSFDADKFYKEAERRIKGQEVAEMHSSATLQDEEITFVVEVREPNPLNMLEGNATDDQIFSPEQEAEFEKMIVLLIVHRTHGDFFNYTGDKLEKYFYEKLEEHFRSSFDREVVHKLIMWIKFKYGDFIRSYLEATYNEDIPF